MKKYIDIPLETLERLVEGKCVVGSLRRDQFTGKITFRAYLRQSRMHQKDKLIKKLPWGWVKESMERIKVFGSFPKDMGTASIMSHLEAHTKDAKNALIEQELDLIEFC